MDERIRRIQDLHPRLVKLTDDQYDLIEKITLQLSRAYVSTDRSPDSDLIDDCVLAYLGDALRLHHCFSREPLSKDRFEYALESAVNHCGRSAALAPRGNPGYDININGNKFSLKTEAARDIKPEIVHISKFMELGKGEWNLETQRDRFFEHMKKYDRILTLRCLSKGSPHWHYELVEIPKDLLLEAHSGTLEIKEESRQSPKPFYFYIRGEGEIRFQLYFDGGTERKLQIQNLRKSLCQVHASWIFSSEEPLEDQAPLDVG